MKYCGAIVNADGVSIESEDDITSGHNSTIQICQLGTPKDSVSLTPPQINERDSDISAVTVSFMVHESPPGTPEDLTPPQVDDRDNDIVVSHLMFIYIGIVNNIHSYS